MNALLDWLTAAPDLPSLALMDGARRVAWALVLAVLAWRGVFGLWRLPAPLRTALAVALGLTALWPGPWGLSHWLGLAFQMPSLTALLVLTLWAFGGRTRSRRFFDNLGSSLADGSNTHFGSVRLGLGPAGLVALGWVLMLDTFAMWPTFIYPLGYSNATLAAAAVTSLALVAVKSSRPLGWVGLAACLLFATTRLPSGNLWDALSDPWLWFIAHGVLIRQIFNKLSFR